MDSSYGFNGPSLKGPGQNQGTGFLMMGTESGKPVLIRVNLPKGADSLQLSGAKRPQKKGVLGAAVDVVKGFGKGAINTIKGLFSLKGILFSLGTMGLCALAGPAVIPFLVAAGVFAGGAQIAKGAATGNWEGVGEGLFTASTSMVGAKIAPKVARNLAGEELILSTSGKAGQQAAKPGFLRGMLEGTANQLRLLFGGKVTQSSNPQASTNIYKMASENVKHNWNTFKQQGATAKESVTKFHTEMDKIVQADPKLQHAVRNMLGLDGKVKLNPTRTHSSNPQVRQAIQQFAKEQPFFWNISNTLKSGNLLSTGLTGEITGSDSK